MPTEFTNLHRIFHSTLLLPALRTDAFFGKTDKLLGIIKKERRHGIQLQNGNLISNTSAQIIIQPSIAYEMFKLTVHLSIKSCQNYAARFYSSQWIL